MGVALLRVAITGLFTVSLSSKVILYLKRYWPRGDIPVKMRLAI